MSSKTSLASSGPTRRRGRPPTKYAMSSVDVKLCTDAMKTLTSPKYTKKQHTAFLRPVNSRRYPNYKEVIKEPMDLGTVKSKMKTFGDRTEFFNTVMLCFVNAMQYHGGKKNAESTKLVESAKFMMELVKKEKKKADDKATAAERGDVEEDQREDIHDDDDDDDSTMADTEEPESEEEGAANENAQRKKSRKETGATPVTSPVTRSQKPRNSPAPKRNVNTKKNEDASTNKSINSTTRSSVTPKKEQEPVTNEDHDTPTQTEAPKKRGRPRKQQSSQRKRKTLSPDPPCLSSPPETPSGAKAMENEDQPPPSPPTTPLPPYNLSTEDPEWMQNFNDLVKWKNASYASCHPERWAKKSHSVSTTNNDDDDDKDSNKKRKRKRKRKYGKTSVLQVWIQEQKRMYKLFSAKNLSSSSSSFQPKTKSEQAIQAKVEKLNSIYFVWNPDQKPPPIEHTTTEFQEYFCELRSFVKSRGDCFVPNTNELGIWCIQQRMKHSKSKLNQQEIHALMSLGFNFEVTDEVDWSKMFLRLMEFKNEFGDCLVPPPIGYDCLDDEEEKDDEEEEDVAGDENGVGAGDSEGEIRQQETSEKNEDQETSEKNEDQETSEKIQEQETIENNKEDVTGEINKEQENEEKNEEQETEEKNREQETEDKNEEHETEERNEEHETEERSEEQENEEKNEQHETEVRNEEQETKEKKEQETSEKKKWRNTEYDTLARWVQRQRMEYQFYLKDKEEKEEEKRKEQEETEHKIKEEENEDKEIKEKEKASDNEDGMTSSEKGGEKKSDDGQKQEEKEGNKDTTIVTPNKAEEEPQKEEEVEHDKKEVTEDDDEEKHLDDEKEKHHENDEKAKHHDNDDVGVGNKEVENYEQKIVKTPTNRKSKRPSSGRPRGRPKTAKPKEVKREESIVLPKRPKSMLTEEQIESLNKLGFIWSTDIRPGWVGYYRRLVDFTKKKGHCKVTKANIPEDLYRWVTTMRQFYKRRKEGFRTNMTDDKIFLLRNIDFQFELPLLGERHGWKKRFEWLCQYKIENGHTLVPQNHPTLGNFVKQLRQAYALYVEGREQKRLNEEKIKLLEEIDFTWRIRERTEARVIAQKKVAEKKRKRRLRQIRREEGEEVDDHADAHSSSDVDNSDVEGSDVDRRLLGVAKRESKTIGPDDDDEYESASSEGNEGKNHYEVDLNENTHTGTLGEKIGHDGTDVEYVEKPASRPRSGGHSNGSRLSSPSKDAITHRQLSTTKRRRTEERTRKAASLSVSPQRQFSAARNDQTEGSAVCPIDEASASLTSMQNVGDNDGVGYHQITGNPAARATFEEARHYEITDLTSAMPTTTTRTAARLTTGLLQEPSVEMVHRGTLTQARPRSRTQEMRCGLCTGIQVRSTCCIPCGHSFCESCVDHICTRLGRMCPTCGILVTDTVWQRHMDGIINHALEQGDFEEFEVNVYLRRITAAAGGFGSLNEQRMNDPTASLQQQSAPPGYFESHLL